MYTQVTSLSMMERTWNHLATGTSNIGTDLSNTANEDSVIVHSSTGADTTILEATTLRAGVMTKVMHDKLTDIEPGAEKNVATDLDASVIRTSTVSMEVTSTTGTLSGAPVLLCLSQQTFLAGLMHSRSRS